MDLIDNFNHSYLEQCQMQLERLATQIFKEDDDSEKLNGRLWVGHRLFRHNVFDDIESSERQHLDKILEHSLLTLGSHINDNLAKQPQETVLIVDRKFQDNYVYDNMGVIHLKPKDAAKYGTCKPRKQALMLHVISKILTLFQNDSYISSRGFFYLSKEQCQASPIKLGNVITDICCLLGCSRNHLRILSQSKGLVYGDLKFTSKSGETFDCLSKKEAVNLPTPRNAIVSISSNAKFVIIIEKDSILQKILNLERGIEFVKKYGAILFTARGYPDINSRAFINFLWTKLRLPILALTDADPHGLEIVCCYKFGCYATASEAAYLAVPHIRWLGLLPIDVSRHYLPESSLMNLSTNDFKKIHSLLKRPYLQCKPEWREQLNLMLYSNKKAELESLESMDSDGDYIVKTYLPNKLRYGSWL